MNARTSPSEAPPNLTPPPAHVPQCSANCASCSTAGASKCDAGSCVTGYGLTSAKTCEPVRQCCTPGSRSCAMCMKARTPPDKLGSAPRGATRPHPEARPRAAVRSQLHIMQHSRCRRLRRGILCGWLRADFGQDMRTGASRMRL